jgi:hypothetical protein
MDRLDPFAVFADEVDEAVDGFGFGDVEFDGLLPDVEIDLSRRATDVTEIGVGHFAGAIHDATHDRDLHAFEMLRAVFDAGGDGLEIEKRAPARWARDVIGFE